MDEVNKFDAASLLDVNGRAWHWYMATAFRVYCPPRGPCDAALCEPHLGLNEYVRGILLRPHLAHSSHRYVNNAAPPFESAISGEVELRRQPCSEGI